jgi:hypothetical protein
MFEVGSIQPRNGQHFKRIPSIPVIASVMEQRGRSKLSAIPAKTVHSLPFTVKFFWKSISLSIAFFSVLLLLFFTFNLPAASDNGSAVYLNPKRLNKHFFNYRNPVAFDDPAGLGDYGEFMVGMLPFDLPFTVFVPSEQYFRRILEPKIVSGVKAIDRNFTEEVSVNSTSDNTIAIISRILGFSAVPLHLPSKSVPLNGERVVDSLSGFRLQLGRVSTGVMFVNNISCEATDARRGQIIVHVVRGVIMDAEFEQSVRPEEDGDLE